VCQRVSIGYAMSMCGVRHLVGGLGRVEIAVEHRVRGVRRGGGRRRLVVGVSGTGGAVAGGCGGVRGRVGGEDRGAVFVAAGGRRKGKDGPEGAKRVRARCEGLVGGGKGVERDLYSWPPGGRGGGGSMLALAAISDCARVIMLV